MLSLLTFKRLMIFSLKIMPLPRALSKPFNRQIRLNPTKSLKLSPAFKNSEANLLNKKPHTLARLLVFAGWFK